MQETDIVKMTLKHVYHVKLRNDEPLEQQILIKNCFVKVTFSFHNLQPTTNTPDRPGAPRDMLKFLILFVLFASVLQ